MFARQPGLVLDVAFGVNFTDLESVNTKKYIDKLRSHLKYAYKIAGKTNLKEIKRHGRRYNKDIKCPKFEEEDLGLVR